MRGNRRPRWMARTNVPADVPERMCPRGLARTNVPADVPARPCPSGCAPLCPSGCGAPLCPSGCGAPLCPSGSCPGICGAAPPERLCIGCTQATRRRPRLPAARPLVARSATSRLGRPLCGRASPDRCICRKDRTGRAAVRTRPVGCVHLAQRLFETLRQMQSRGTVTPRRPPRGRPHAAATPPPPRRRPPRRRPAAPHAAAPPPAPPSAHRRRFPAHTQRPGRAGPLGPSRRLDAPMTLDALDDRRALAGNRLVRRRRRRRAPGRTTPPRERSP